MRMLGPDQLLHAAIAKTAIMASTGWDETARIHRLEVAPSPLRAARSGALSPGERYTFVLTATDDSGAYLGAANVTVR